MTALALQTNWPYHDQFIGLGLEAQCIEEESEKVYEHSVFPISMQSDIHRFCNLAETWKEETQLSSSINEIELNQSYLEIIGMGKKVLPHILQDLKLKPSHWFLALRAITGLSPIKRSHRGNIKLMTEDWIKWGEDNGYL